MIIWLSDHEANGSSIQICGKTVCSEHRLSCNAAVRRYGRDATQALRYTVLYTSEKVPGTGVVDVIDELPRKVADT
jgi:hypothetical protein